MKDFKMELLTPESFKTKIFDYTNGGDWNFLGEHPAIIDFYADWCGPCKMLGPIFEKLSAEFEGKVNFYKIDTEAQQELAQLFQVSSIPSILFIPKGAEPQMAQGALPEHALREAINDVLKPST